MNALFQKTGAALAAILVIAGSGASVAFAKEGKTADQKAAHALKVEKKASTVATPTTTAKNNKNGNGKGNGNNGNGNGNGNGNHDGNGSDLANAIKSGDMNAIIRIAQQMIDTRIQSLNDLTTELNSFKHLSDSDKASLTAQVQSNRSAMISLRSKIGNDTDLNTLIADAKSITKDYQIGTLANPQVHKMAVADRTEAVVSVFQNLIPKLQTRINDANQLSAAGNKTRAQNALDDMKAKVNQASNLADSAEAMVSELKLSDDKASKDANAKVFAQASAKLQAAHDDLKAARADLDTIESILGGKR